MDNEREAQACDGQLSHPPIFRERLILASTSPRRAEILRAVGWPFEVASVEVDETAHAGESPVPYVERLARAKAAAGAHRHPGKLVLGADTVVIVDEEMLGKPRDMEDARRMLRQLSDRWHDVLTGVALVREREKPESLVGHERTRVRFSPMSEAEINWHADNGRPLDKAGAYAVQGRAALFIEEIRGDYWNIVGLPVRLVYKLVREI